MSSHIDLENAAIARAGHVFHSQSLVPDPRPALGRGVVIFDRRATELPRWSPVHGGRSFPPCPWGGRGMGVSAVGPGYLLTAVGLSAGITAHRTRR